MKKLTDASIKGILSAIASGEHLSDVAKKFKVAEISIGNIARGATHASVTGLVGDNSGVKYLRDNKQKFIITKKPRATKTELVDPVSETPVEQPVVQDHIAVASTPIPRKSKKKPVGVVTTTIEDRVKGLKDQASQIVVELDNSIGDIQNIIDQKLAEIDELRGKKNDMELSRTHWKSVLTAMNPES
jgi:hypothetical protein